jgi:hypothetical protein
MIADGVNRYGHVEHAAFQAAILLVFSPNRLFF